MTIGHQVHSVPRSVGALPAESKHWTAQRRGSVAPCWSVDRFTVTKFCVARESPQATVRMEGETEVPDDSQGKSPSPVGANVPLDQCLRPGYRRMGHPDSRVYELHVLQRDFQSRSWRVGHLEEAYPSFRSQVSQGGVVPPKSHAVSPAIPTK